MRRRHSWITFDLLASLAIVLTVLGGLAYVARAAVQVQAITLLERQLRGVAELELACARAGVEGGRAALGDVGLGLEEIEVHTTRAPGAGLWSGFERVTVEVRGRSVVVGERRLRLAAYLPVDTGSAP